MAQAFTLEADIYVHAETNNILKTPNGISPICHTAVPKQMTGAMIHMHTV